MIRKKILISDWIRKDEGCFGFIPHRFLTDGFFAELSQHELLLYLFLTLAADRYGLSFYGCNSICSLLSLNVDQYLNARDGLIEKDLLAFNGTIFQVLSLPASFKKLPRQKQFQAKGKRDPVSIAQVLNKSLRGLPHDR